MTEEQIREEIAKIIAGSRDETCNGCGSMVEADNPETTTDRILSIKGIRIEAGNQELPDPDCFGGKAYSESMIEDMLQEGWVKCLKKEGK